MPDEQIAWDILVDEDGTLHRFVVALPDPEEARRAAWAEVDSGATVVSCSRLPPDLTKMLWPMLEGAASRLIRWRPI